MGKKGTSRKQQGLGFHGIPADKRNQKALKRGVSLLKLGTFALPCIVAAVPAILLESWISLAIGVAVGLMLFANAHVVLEWESAVVLRFGHLHRIQGPGVFFTIPFVEFVAAFMDQRVTATTFSAERTLTADCVPVDVDAVLYWMVWDPKSACVEVANYRDAVFWVAQTTLRDAIGNVSIAELSTRRKMLDDQIKEALVAKTETWGITVISVEMRDIIIPKGLQDALSREAQAERERSARITLAEVEEDISEMFVRAAKNYEEEESALRLRAMNMAYDGFKEKGGLVLLPNSLVEAFGDTGSGSSGK